MSKSTSQSSAEFSITAVLAKKWRLATRLYRHDGLLALSAEIFCQLIKPAVWTYDSFRWWLYHAMDKKSVTVWGSEMAVIPNDPGISRELALYKVHEPLESRLLLKTLKPGMTVVDIGGNIGYYAMMEARTVGTKGNVIAIEPMPKNFHQLSKNVQANGYEQIHLHHMAIGDQNGTASMFVSGKSNWHSLRRNPSTVGEIQVKVSTLDTLLASYELPSVDLVRMDLEGYEVSVIDGMLETIEKYSPRLLVELHPDLLGKEVMQDYLHKLEKLGYGVEWLFEQERDFPIRWRFLKIETPTMRELMEDSRICIEPRALTALFSRRARPESETLRVKEVAWQTASSDSRSSEMEALAGSGISRRESTTIH